jgi:hypothetical protein
MSDEQKAAKGGIAGVSGKTPHTWHPESRFFRDEGSAFVTENPYRSFAAAQDDSFGGGFFSSSFCPSWAVERPSMPRMIERTGSG